MRTWRGAKGHEIPTPNAKGVVKPTEAQEQIPPSIDSPQAVIQGQHGMEQRPSSWYSSWLWGPQHTSATCALESETISASVQGSILCDRDHVPYRRTVCQSVRGNRKSEPLAAAPTMINVLKDDNAMSARQIAETHQSSVIVPKNLLDKDRLNSLAELPSNKSEEPTDDKMGQSTVGDDAVDNSSQPSIARWHSWWSRPGASNHDKDRHSGSAARTPDHTDTIRENDQADHATLHQSNAKEGSVDTNEIKTESPDNTPKSWLPRWSTHHQIQVQNDQKTTAITLPVMEQVSERSKSLEREQTVQASGWAFWASALSKQTTPTPGGTQSQVGELAVANSPSQSHPETAQFNEQPVPTKISGISIGKKKQRESIDGGKDHHGFETVRERSVIGDESSISTSTPSAINLVQPEIDTYPKAPVAGYISWISKYLAQNLHLERAPNQWTNNCVYVTAKPPTIGRAVAIGVHGFYPSQMVRMVLGPPTGTSVRFANAAASAIKSWCNSHQPAAPNAEIEKIALEGEGLVADRVNILWKLLLNWLSHLKQADLIFMACHSQGVPVACMLMAKLIQLGCIPSNTRLGICAMAGINLGPFPEYKVRLFGGSALELFDFGQSSSQVSKAYAEALDVCLRHGVRITYIGSLDDQLVSLESSLFMPLNHPYVSRAIFIDGRLHTSNFLIHLVTLALKLRNLGYSDHGLIRELSGPLAGSLVGGDGHSRLYDDPRTYARALEYTLRSTSIFPFHERTGTDAASSLLANDKIRARQVATARRATVMGYPSSSVVANGIRRGLTSSSTTLPGIGPTWLQYDKSPQIAAANPFYLPWAVRGIFEEQALREDDSLQEEVVQLIQEFKEWHPTSKVLKDVRWRLEGIQALV